jgi:hypothetical protein
MYVGRIERIATDVAVMIVARLTTNLVMNGDGKME